MLRYSRSWRAICRTLTSGISITLWCTHPESGICILIQRAITTFLLQCISPNSSLSTDGSLSGNVSIKYSKLMQILFIGDIFGSPGRKIVRDHLDNVVETNKVDLVIANAENSAGGVGLTPAIADELFDLGCHVLTTGTHVWDKR